MQVKKVCVFASSSEAIDSVYFDVARELGESLAINKIGLVFGGGNDGLMGAIAKEMYKSNGEIIGVIPERLNKPGVAYPYCSKLIVTDTMHERKQTMETISDGFIVLPGGFGTLEEALEVITLKQLGYHNKPIEILNVNGYFNNLLFQFEDIYNKGFADCCFKSLYSIAGNGKEAVSHIKSYTPPMLLDKIKKSAEVAR